jgi:molybdopterin synthase catalytic subunit
MKTYIELTEKQIVLPTEPDGETEVGAQVDFQGIVRGTEKGEPIQGLNYQAHEPMAHLELKKIMAELGALYPCDAVWITHRLGFIPVGEIALFVRVRSKHRKAALLLIDELIDQLKRDVPIWKIS